MALLQQVTVNTLYRIGFLVFQLLNTVLISRICGPEGLGLFSLLIVNGTVLHTITSLGIPAGMVFHASTGDIPLTRLLKILWFSTFAQLILIGLFEWIHYGITGRYFIWTSDGHLTGLAGLALFVTIVITEKYYALYNGLRRFALFNFIVLAWAALQFLALLYIWVTRKGDTKTILLIYILLQLLQTLTLALIFRSKGIGKDAFKGEREDTRRSFITYSFFAYLANALHFLVSRVDFWFLDHFHGAASLGIYALAARIGQVFLVLPALLAGVLLPSITSSTVSSGSFERLLRILNTLNALAMLLLGVTAFFWMPVVFGARFGDSALPLVLLFPGILCLAIQILLTAYFAGKGQPRINFIGTLISLAVVVILDLMLIPHFGPAGAAVASTIAYATGTGFGLVHYLRREHYKVNRLFIERADILWLLGLIRNPDSKWL